MLNKDKKLKILVSACLLGDNCKYNGKNNLNEKVIELIKENECVKFCPELLAGLGVPRVKAELKEGMLISENGSDLSANMNLAIERIEKILNENDFDIAILKSKSPSCGYKKIYDGTFSKTLIDGNGFACNLLLKKGIKVYSDEDFN